MAQTIPVTLLPQKFVFALKESHCLHHLQVTEPSVLSYGKVEQGSKISEAMQPWTKKDSIQEGCLSARFRSKLRL